VATNSVALFVVCPVNGVTKAKIYGDKKTATLMPTNISADDKFEVPTGCTSATRPKTAGMKIGNPKPTKLTPIQTIITVLAEIIAHSPRPAKIKPVGIVSRRKCL